MNRTKILTILILTLTGAVAFYFFRAKNQVDEKKVTVETVLVGIKPHQETFGESLKSAKVFYDIFNQALEKKEANDFEVAIKLLNESLPHVGIIVERDMVYTELAEIYRIQGNQEQELKYIDAILISIPKNAPPSKRRDELINRAAELRQLLATKS